ncbi:MAG: hypothetical protein JO017_01745 [Actinobacteria bacterium]|nr:hypothetical protein [Actinomycetota bacterium]
MGSRSAAEMLGLPVRLHDIRLGRPVDLVLDAAGQRVLGFVVVNGDDAQRFLPFAASQTGDGEIAVASALMLLDDVGFYRKRGLSFRSLVGTDIVRGRATVGTLVDVIVGKNGDVEELEVDARGTRARVPAAGSTVTPPAATAA